MRFLLLSALFLNTTILSAASYEVNLEELMPQQSLFKTLTIEAEALQIDATLSDGSNCDVNSSMDTSNLSDISYLSISGPEVNFILTTQSGDVWSRELNSFELFLSNELVDGRRELSLKVLSTPSLKSQLKETAKKTLQGVAHYLFKALVLDSQGAIKFHLTASTNVEDYFDSEMNVKLDINKQYFQTSVKNQGNLKVGTWTVHGHLLGQDSLIGILFKAGYALSESVSELPSDTYFNTLVKSSLEYINFALMMLTPVTHWDGVGVTLDGSFEYESFENNAFSTQLKNKFLLDAYDGNWNAEFGSKTFLKMGEEIPTEWMQDIILTNPAQDVQKIAEWIQEHGVDQLAALLNTPSISYYASYFPKYFLQSLNSLLLTLGEPLEDGTLRFSLSNDSTGSFQIGTLNFQEIGSQFIADLKAKATNWWWGS